MSGLSRLLRCCSSSFVACRNRCAADCASLLVGAELSDLAVALHASRRFLSKAAFDCTSKMAHSAVGRVACSRRVGAGKRGKWNWVRGWEWGVRREVLRLCTVCNLPFHPFWIYQILFVNGLHRQLGQENEHSHLFCFFFCLSELRHGCAIEVPNGPSDWVSHWEGLAAAKAQVILPVLNPVNTPTPLILEQHLLKIEALQ